MPSKYGTINFLFYAIAEARSDAERAADAMAKEEIISAVRFYVKEYLKIIKEENLND